MPPSSKTTLVTGIRGQEGSRLAELLLKTGHSVHGIKRRATGYGLRPASRAVKNGIFFSHELWRCGERGAGPAPRRGRLALPGVQAVHGWYELMPPTVADFAARGSERL